MVNWVVWLQRLCAVNYYTASPWIHLGKEITIWVLDAITTKLQQEMHWDRLLEIKVSEKA